MWTSLYGVVWVIARNAKHTSEKKIFLFKSSTYYDTHYPFKLSNVIIPVEK